MTIVNTETGEIVERDPEEAAAVAMLSNAIAALTSALGEMPIEEIVTTKAKVSTVQTATKELGMSKEAQDLATEAVRRAEWALGRAIRKGQEEGLIASRGMNRYNVDVVDNKVYDFVTASEWHGNRAASATGISSLAEASREEFDAAIDAAKTEGNLSRANVARKLMGQKSNVPLTQRVDEIRALADKGATSAHIAKALNATEENVRDVARRNGVLIVADAVRGKVRRLNHDAILDNVAESIEVAAMALRDVDPSQLNNKDEALERLDSLTTSINALRQAVRKIKESFHE